LCTLREIKLLERFMGGDSMRIRAGGLAFAFALLAGACGAGHAFCAEYEVRLPVQKTARLAPIGEMKDAQAQKNATTAPNKSDKTQDKGPKTAMGKAVEAAAAAEAEREAKAAPVKQPKSAAHPRKTGEANLVVPTGTPIPVPVPEGNASPANASPAKKAPSPAPVPSPTPPPDPKAGILPQPPATAKDGQKPIGLPGEGQWVGELRVDFEEQRVVLHAATNRPAGQVTWFNQGQPRKLAIDLRGQWKKKGAHVLRFDVGPIKNIIVGDHPDRMRLAVEFRDGAVAPAFEPTVETAPNGVQVSIPLAIRLKN
jgi:hypothetical protein